MQRREFLRHAGVVLGGVAAVAVIPSVAGATAAVVLAQPKKQDLSTVSANDVITAKSWNNLVGRVNELSEALR